MVSGRNVISASAWPGYVAEQATANTVKFIYVPSKDNLADIFTKLLPETQFRRLRDMLLSKISDNREKVSTGGGCQVISKFTSGTILLTISLTCHRQPPHCLLVCEAS